MGGKVERGGVNPERLPGPVRFPSRLWGLFLGLNLMRVTSPEHTHGRQQDKKLKDLIVGLIPGACKKPRLWLTGEMGGPIE